LSDVFLNNIVFHIGMIEMLSYWKAACSPKIIVKPFSLNEEQVMWWKNLYFNGLGEFFYLNNISTNIEALVDFTFTTDGTLSKAELDLTNANLIPMGGGKDSALTYELLSTAEKDNLIFFLNPQHVPIQVIDVENRKTPVITAQREIASELLELNKQGFLNGHTPFSAMLAFLSLLVSGITGRKNIVLSNESSANESTVSGTAINHQYSKTYAFESDFRHYVHKYISESFNYYSFLRPLNELQIAFLFSAYPHFFNKFRSCNVGSKQGVWCCNCSKCLFTYLMLSAFVDKKELMVIFGENLFEKRTLLLYLEQLTGNTEIKPFDCVGTIEEVNTALIETVEKYKSEPLPYLLNQYVLSYQYKTYKNKDFKLLLKQFNEQHFVSETQVKILKENLNVRISEYFPENR